jgi:hypothetical protein
MQSHLLKELEIAFANEVEVQLSTSTKRIVNSVTELTVAVDCQASSQFSVQKPEHFSTPFAKQCVRDCNLDGSLKVAFGTKGVKRVREEEDSVCKSILNESSKVAKIVEDQVKIKPVTNKRNSNTLLPETRINNFHENEELIVSNNDLYKALAIELTSLTGFSTPEELEISDETTTNMISSQISIHSETYSCKSGNATFKDIDRKYPTYDEIFELVRNRRNSEQSEKLIQVATFYQINKKTKSSELTPACKAVYDIVIDLFVTVMLYGYKVKLTELRSRIIRVWMTYAIRAASIISKKTLVLQAHLGFTNLDHTRRDQFGNVLPSEDWETILEVSTWMKVVKYKLAAFAAYAKHSTVYPKCPFDMKDNPAMLLDQDFHRWFKVQPNNTLQQRVWKMSLIDSLCRGVKKGATRSTDSDCLLNSIETFFLFTTPKDKTEYKYGDNVVTIKEMEQEIIRSVHEIIGDSVYEPKYNLCPSFSSCTENSLTSGGHVKIVKGFIPPYPREPQVIKKHGMLFNPFPCDGFNNTDQENPPCRTRLPSIDEDSFQAIRKIGEMRAIEYLEFSTNPELLGTDLIIEDLLSQCLLNESIIKPIGLKEALKVRGITTPCALETWLLKPLQKFLSKCLLKHLCFAVTGTPLTHKHLEDVLVNLLDDEFFVSGDYDNATNMMISSYTRVCITAICEKLGLSEDYTKVAVRSLCDNLVSLTWKEYYGPDRCDYTELNLKGVQREAQPMGKILSFVVLCIINFSVCRKAVEIDSGRIIPIRLFPGLINGDDCCFPIRNFEHWVGCSQMVGLFNSIGKTFCSREFVEMNSRTFLVNPNNDPLRLRFREVPFINFGLMKGMVRSDGGKLNQSPQMECAEAITRMGWCHRELVKDFDFLWKDLDHLFKYYHNKYLLDPMLKGIPYYIPHWLGGLGLDPGPNYIEIITETQLKCAKWIYQHFEEIKPKSICLSKTCLIDSLINKAMSKWLKNAAINEYIDNFMDLEKENGQIVNLEEENQKVYSDMVEYLWRTRKIDDFFKEMTDNFAEVNRKQTVSKIYYNQKIWQMGFNYVNKQTSYKTLEWFKLWHQKQSRVKPIVGLDPVYEYTQYIDSVVQNSTKKRVGS